MDGPLVMDTYLKSPIIVLQLIKKTHTIVQRIFLLQNKKSSAHQNSQ